jgi:arylsulfatase A-like enzyme
MAKDMGCVCMNKESDHNNNKSNSSISLMRTYIRTLALLLLFIVVFINYKQLIQFYSAFSLANAMTHIEIEHLSSKGLLLDLGYFLGIVFLLHACWAAVITVSCRSWFLLSDNDNVKTQCWLILLLLHYIFILSANAYFYPTSLLGILRGTPLANGAFIGILGTLLITNFIFAMVQALLPRKRLFIASALVMTLLTPVVLYNVLRTTEQSLATSSDKPNIIIIGIDGLRPDHLAHKGADNKLAPNINKLLSQSLIYDRTYTPQARTYVAWMGILTGQYPITNGARFNLAPPELVDLRLPLITALKAQGYQATYAMDERRFNQIDESYGFDKAIGPKIGAADAIIASFADLPLINLWVNTPASHWLFPYLYINRAYGKTYNPHLFNQEVLNGLAVDKPNFLAVHFCQLHWPFTSKDFIELDKSRWDGNYNHYMYQEMIKKVDRQVDEFMKGLQGRGQLNNAQVYLLSDHGEGFMLAKDRLTLDKLHSSQTEDSDNRLNVAAWGHGTNNLAQEQSEVLLASIRYKQGKPVNQAGVVKGLFSLVDVAPSIFEAQDFKLEPQDNPFDGRPLKALETNTGGEEYVFVESSLPVNAINASFIDDKKVMSETASHYEIRDNGRIVMKPADYQANIRLKQRSVYYQDWQLTLLPKDNNIILVNTREKSWQSLANYQGDAPWRKMLNSLCKHYEKDLDSMSEYNASSCNF